MPSNTVSPAFIAALVTDTMARRRAAEQGTGMDEAIEGFSRASSNPACN